ncbi:NADH-quinone oxidoreductase subunit NuoB [Nitrosopumilus sp.]|uniref:NADH-quinone oxidoreductase subunit NuoB n=1 Tax=Nitrosopumilus sp. TaxID=2024843 RepID=UPI00247D76B3|nr:NADH-quinone oxidoreductase subunit NuoB [Nitrosopumilus sp.]MCV0411234.1 NADH-quinone oxidoreductase subunit NuoB [Nitrosopumilus sp.]
MTEDNQKIKKSDILSWDKVTLDKILQSNDMIPGNFRGKISLDPDKDFVLNSHIGQNLENICPTNAISYKNPPESISLDVGKCIFCGNCQQEAPQLIKISNNFDVAKKRKNHLLEVFSESVPFGKTYEEIGNELKNKINKTFGRSLAIREIDAGSCNGCEIEISALTNPIYDIERFGMHFVASPRHADLLLVTGPASKNMEKALKIAYESTPEPKLVIAVGACACSGGIFGKNYATTGGIDSIVPVDVFIPGCPPRPQALIYGIMLALDKI